MKKVTVTIASKDYTITLDEEFALFFEEDMRNYIKESNALSVKELLTAFVQKCYETYRHEDKINNICLKISESIDED